METGLANTGLADTGLDRRAFGRLSLGAVGVTLIPLASRAAADPVATLNARAGELRLMPVATTAVWGYGGQVPGPLLRIRKGEELRVRLVNDLALPTTLCWRGVRILNPMDGVGGLTQKPVMPGETFEYRFTPPDAGLYWYHPHVWPTGAMQTRRGLYGVLIVDEVDPPKVDADLLVVLDDWSLDAQAQVRGDNVTEGTSGSNETAALMTVNGRPVPAAETFAPGARVRFRLLNACASRVCVVGFMGLKPMVVAIDGQPSELFAPMRETVPIGPGSRFEIIADLPADGGTAALVLRGDGEPDASLMSLATRGKPFPARPAIAKLPDNPLLPTRIHLERSLRKVLVIGAGASGPASGSATRTARGKAAVKGETAPIKPAGDASESPHPWRWTLNGVASDGVSGKPLFTQKRGGAVTLTVINTTAVVQQIHVHGHVWRLLHDLDDGWDPYWRDSVLLAPGKTKHVAFIADNPGKWAIGSSFLDRQETGLAAWFEVT